ncbi:hypothetical protein QYM36_006567, partial [Artemia franciscana]
MARGYSDAKIYVGDLGNNASKSELEDAFSYYGRLRNVWVARNPPGFAFVEFDDTRDAEDAVRGLDGRTICGRRVRVELSSGRRRSGRGGNRNIRDERCYDCGERGHFARDCRKGGGGGGRNNRRRSPSRSRSRDRRSESRDRSRSASRNRS